MNADNIKKFIEQYFVISGFRLYDDTTLVLPHSVVGISFHFSEGPKAVADSAKLLWRSAFSIDVGDKTPVADVSVEKEEGMFKIAVSVKVLVE